MNALYEITIEVSKNELKVVVDTFDDLMKHPAQTRKAKAARSACYDAYKKLQRKLLTKPLKNKKYNLKLKHHEADWLEITLRIILGINENHFLRTFTDKLHEKLA